METQVVKMIDRKFLHALDILNIPTRTPLETINI